MISKMQHAHIYHATPLKFSFIFILLLLFLFPKLALADGPPNKKAATDPFISEVAPVSGQGSPAWVEIVIPASSQFPYKIYLPVIIRPGTSTPTQAAPATIARQVATLNLGGWIISDEDGNTYTIPAELPAAPQGGVVLIRLEAGTDDLDFSDGIATLYASTIPTDTFDAAGDQLTLYSAMPFSSSTLVDFIAWGTDPGEDDTLAVEADKWSDNSFHIFDPGFGVGSADSPSTPNDSVGIWDDSLVSYRAGNSSPGQINPPPAPMGSTIADGAILSAETFGLTWSGAKNALYEFELADTAAFTNVLISDTLDFPGWKPDAPLPNGEYFWRVRIVDRNGNKSGYIGPLKVVSDNTLMKQLPQVEKVLLADNEYKIQRKDTTMLDIGGGSGNSNLGNNGSPRTGTRNRWDGPHEFGNGDRSFSWNGYDNFYCVRASVAMMNDYYGGNMSQDRLSYYLFEEEAANNNPTKNIPEGDMGYSQGIGSYGNQGKVLSWALNNASISGVSYCPAPEGAAGDGYTCPAPSKQPMTWDEVINLIDAGKPFISINLNNAHARVVDGYRIVGNTKQVHILDPVPVTCNSGDHSCDGRRWEAFSTFQDDNERTYAILFNFASGRNQEPLHLDHDGDGVNTFDELYRFGTHVFMKDTDGDWSEDKEDIAAYVFYSDETNYTKVSGDWPGIDDPDTIRKELDWDNDGDNVPDGCEESFLATLSTFLQQDCTPIFDIIDPTQNQPRHVGPRNQPKNFWSIATVEFPPALPNFLAPAYSQNDFSGFVGTTSGGVFTADYNVINFAQIVGEKVGLKISPPPVPNAGEYDFAVYLKPNGVYKTSDLKDDAVIYGPRQLGVNNILVGNGGNDGGPKFQAIKIALQLYISQWHIGDTISLMTLGGQARMPITPTTVTIDGRDLIPMRDFVNSLAPVAEENDLIGALELAKPNPGDPTPKLMFAAAGPVRPGSLQSFFGDANLDGTVDPQDFFASTNPYSMATIYPIIIPDTGKEPWIANVDNTATAINATPAILRLNSAPNANEPQTEVNRLAEHFKATAEQMLGEQRLLTAVGTIARLDSFSYTITIEDASTIAFTANFSEANMGGIEVFRPDGKPVSSGDTDTQHIAYSQHEHFRVMNPVSGTWMLVVKSISVDNVGTEYIAFVSADSPPVFEVVPGFRGRDQFNVAPKAYASVGQISREFSSYSPLLDATAFTTTTGLNLTAEIATPTDPRPLSLPLFDDGMHNDGSANDGLYGISPFTPTVSGAYVMRATLVGMDDTGQPFSHTVRDDFFYQKPLAYVYSSQSDLFAMFEYTELLADMGLPLTGIAQTDMSSTDWNQFDAILIAPDSSTFGSNWGTVALGLPDVISNTNLRIIGLGEGGYALFNELGLTIGTNGVTATTGLTLTQPFAADDLMWSTPYPLNGTAPYQVYTETGGLTLNLNVTAPLTDVQILALDPNNGQAIVAAEDQRFLLWGYQNSPTHLTDDGKRFFLNLMNAILVY